MNSVSTSTSGTRRMVALTAAAVMLAVAFVVAPGRLAAGRLSGGLIARRDLIASVHAGFVDYWRSGARRLSPDLARVVDYWLRFHAAKALIAAALLVVLVFLGAGRWRAFVAGAGSGWRRLGVAAAGVVVAGLALLSAVVALANVQGAAAPFTSLLPLLVAGRTDSGLRSALSQVRHGLATGRRTPPALGVMVDDFARYHVVFAVIAAIVAVILAALVVVSVRAARDDRRDVRAKSALRLTAGAAALLALAVIVVGVANAGTASNPEPALLALFNGGW